MGAKNSASLRADRCHEFFVLQPLTPDSWLPTADSLTPWLHIVCGGVAEGPGEGGGVVARVTLGFCCTT